MNALRSVFLRRETGIAVMIVLFTLAVTLYKPQFFSVNNLRVILLLTRTAMPQRMLLECRRETHGPRSAWHPHARAHTPHASQPRAVHPPDAQSSAQEYQPAIHSQSEALPR